MAKPEWGTKRLCQGCGTKFYDLGESPIVCPDCGEEFKEVVTTRAAAPKPEPAKPPKHDRRKRTSGDDDDDKDDDVLDDDDIDDDEDIGKVIDNK